VPDLGPTASDIDRVDADWSAAAFVVAERDPSLADSRASGGHEVGRGRPLCRASIRAATALPALACVANHKPYGCRPDPRKEPLALS
jgi:hypothetical protein